MKSRKARKPSANRFKRLTGVQKTMLKRMVEISFCLKDSGTRPLAKMLSPSGSCSSLVRRERQGIALTASIEQFSDQESEFW